MQPIANSVLRSSEIKGAVQLVQRNPIHCRVDSEVAVVTPAAGFSSGLIELDLNTGRARAIVSPPSLRHALQLRFHDLADLKMEQPVVCCTRTHAHAIIPFTRVKINNGGRKASSHQKKKYAEGNPVARFGVCWTSGRDEGRKMLTWGAVRLDGIYVHVQSLERTIIRQ